MAYVSHKTNFVGVHKPLHLDLRLVIVIVTGFIGVCLSQRVLIVLFCELFIEPLALLFPLPNFALIFYTAPVRVHDFHVHVCSSVHICAEARMPAHVNAQPQGCSADVLKADRRVHSRKTIPNITAPTTVTTKGTIKLKPSEGFDCSHSAVHRSRSAAMSGERSACIQTQRKQMPSGRMVRSRIHRASANLPSERATGILT